MTDFQAATWRDRALNRSVRYVGIVYIHFGLTIRVMVVTS